MRDVRGDHDAVGQLLPLHELREYERLQLGEYGRGRVSSVGLRTGLNPYPITLNPIPHKSEVVEKGSLRCEEWTSGEIFTTSTTSTTSLFCLHKAQWGLRAPRWHPPLCKPRRFVDTHPGCLIQAESICLSGQGDGSVTRSFS